MSEEAPVLSDEIKELADKCNEKHVRVVQAILSGDYSSNMAAYQSVYTEENDESAMSAVSRMLRIDKVSALHAALKDQKLAEGILTRTEAMKILSDMAGASMGDIATFGNREIGEDEEGNPIMQATWTFRNAEDMDEKGLRSISELSATKDGLKIKQHDQKAAIKQLSEMSGWNSAKEIKLSGELKATSTEMTLEEATRIFEDNMKKTEA